MMFLNILPHFHVKNTPLLIMNSFILTEKFLLFINFNVLCPLSLLINYKIFLTRCRMTICLSLEEVAEVDFS